MITLNSIRDDIFRVAQYGEFSDFTRLLNSGIDVNSIDTIGCSLLFYASGRQSDGVPFVKLLLQKGASPDSGTRTWDRPVENAVCHGGTEILTLLIAGGVPVERDHLFHAYDKETFMVVADNLQIDESDPIWRKLLFRAAEKGDCDHIIEDLSLRGVNMDLRDEDTKGTPLMTAIQNKNIATAKKLVLLGADVNAEDKTKNTPLIWYVRNDPKVRPSFLIHAGADIYHLNKFGKDAIQISKSLSPLCFSYLIALDRERENNYPQD
ncbi:MAG: ankyrin repeat domain-containing protein [Sphaerochaeta sp.]|nr:ankyrin repeat domain-containing protein [Sphaerochaeta sp.]